MEFSKDYFLGGAILLINKPLNWTSFQVVNKVSWLISNSQKNNMEPIMVEIQPAGLYIDESSHEGEEFGYVLLGQIEVQVGKRLYKVRKGESFYYRSNVDHRISNPYKKTAQLLMVSTPPSF